jgi:hypothetical protein
MKLLARQWPMSDGKWLMADGKGTICSFNKKPKQTQRKG